MGLFSKVLAVQTLGASTLIKHAADKRSNDAAQRAEAEQTTRVVTLKASPKHLGQELAKEIAKQAKDGFTLTSQSAYSGRADYRGILTLVFTATHDGDI